MIWAANILRIAALIMLGSSGAADLAVGGFHSQAGWIAFNAVGLGLIALVQSTSVFARGTALEENSWISTPTAVFLADARDPADVHDLGGLHQRV